jgi:hypothetical protein
MSSEQDKEIEKNIRLNQHYSLGGAILNSGGGLMSGGSPVPLVKQAQTEADQWIRHNLHDTDGALEKVLMRYVEDRDDAFGKNPDNPLVVLKELFQKILNPSTLREMVRQADVEYGKNMCERPIFQAPGAPAKDGDPYTHQSVEETLNGLIKKLEEV